MYVATMIYPLKNDALDDFISIWNEKILCIASTQTGFIRMQLITRDEEAMAMGTWANKAAAENFMSLGAFKDLMADVKRYLTGKPAVKTWTLAAFKQR